jgi:hypothetical protein
MGVVTLPPVLIAVVFKLYIYLQSLPNLAVNAFENESIIVVVFIGFFPEGISRIAFPEYPGNCSTRG